MIKEQYEGRVSPIPKVSVILTSYNHEKYLRESIDSVLNQTFQDFELLIWDDCSTDNSWELIQSYKDQKIKTFKTQSSSYCWYFNEAIQKARGNYIALQHSDDVWELNKLEKQVSYLEAHSEITALFTGVQIIDEDGNHVAEDWFNENNQDRNKLLRELFYERNRLNHPSILIRKECYAELGGYKLWLTQLPDAEMWSRLLLKKSIFILQEKLVKHRKFRDQSNVSGAREDSIIRCANEWNLIRKNYLELDNFEDLLAIFPSIEEYKNPHGFNIKFLLSMLCLEEACSPSARQLGLSWLFELMNNAVSRAQVETLYSFSYKNLMEISAKNDIYSTIPNKEKEILLIQQNTSLAEKDATITEKEEIILEKDARIEEQKITIEKITDYLLTQQKINVVEKKTLILGKSIQKAKQRINFKKELFFSQKNLQLLKKTINYFSLFLPNSLLKNKITTDAFASLSCFDENWYLFAYPDVLKSGMMPFTHYMEYGWKELRNPHWLFDIQFFLEKYPEIKKQKLEPFSYYCREGWKIGMQPHPAFNIGWYTETTPESRYQNPLLHYLTKGWKTGCSPNPLFLPSWYLEKYPDLPKKDYNPFFHYLNFGKAEKRFPNPFNVPFYKEEISLLRSSVAYQKQAKQYISEKISPFLKALNKDKETVLLISHEASRTGAPILVYNLASSLRKKYNVIILTLEGGDLQSDFQSTSEILIGPLTPKQKSPEFLFLFFKEITEKINIKYSIVNSIVSSDVLLPLFENNIVIIHLIHEFFAYTRPADLFLNSAFFSDKQIYSANIVRDNAIKEQPELRYYDSTVLPQGLCKAPGDANDKENEQILDQIWPKNLDVDTVIILGVGTVELRKGVDLFIATAKRVKELLPTKKFQFIWIGSGFDSDFDARYSVYLADQIARSNLDDIIKIIKPIANIEYAYSLVDIIFLSSRLDPLPLVALDALSHGKPLICFESATGIAEYLLSDPIAAFGVISYLDTEKAAIIISQLIENKSIRVKMGASGHKLISSQFNLEKYAKDIDDIALQCIKNKKNEKQDEDILKNSNLLNQDYITGFQGQFPYCSFIKWYIRNQKNHLQLKKPFPGFHPGIYAEHYQIENITALNHYISEGFPSGPWKSRIIDKNLSKVFTKTSLATALHIHLYYPESAQEILHRLRGINYQVDLLISVNCSEVNTIAKEVFSKYKNGNVFIQEFPNRGRNLGALLTGFGKIITQQYKIIGHIHTKKLSNIGVQRIRNTSIKAHFLYSNLLSGYYDMANTILQEFQNNPQLGLVFPDDPNIVSWGENKIFAKKLLTKMKIDLPLNKEHINFPLDSMFWARTEALKPLFNLNLNWEDYPEEPAPHDGTILHAIKRLLPLMVHYTNYDSASTYLKGVGY